MRIALARGLMRRQVALDLGIGLSTQQGNEGVFGCSFAGRAGAGFAACERAASARDPALAGGEGRSEKGDSFLRRPKAMRFAFSDHYSGERCHGPIRAGCAVALIAGRAPGDDVRRRSVSARTGCCSPLFATSTRQPWGSYGRPQRTEELKEPRANADHRRSGRLMRRNTLQMIRTHMQGHAR